MAFIFGGQLRGELLLLVFGIYYLEANESYQGAPGSDKHEK
jgi:hypothetical protein